MTDVIISKLNEVYLRVHCDSSISLELWDYFAFFANGYRFSPRFRDKEWDGKLRLYSRGKLYIGLLDKLEEFCRDRGYTYETEDAFSTVPFSVVEGKEHIDSLNLPTVLNKRKFEVEQHQLDALLHCIRHTRGLLVSPTSSGKSLIIYMLIRYYAVRTLIIVPRKALTAQMCGDFEDYNLPPGYTHQIKYGAEKWTKHAITVATWQSARKMPQEWLDQFGMVIVDEAHEAKAKSITNLLERMTKCPHRFGLTGTLDDCETNKLVLQGLFGPPEYVTTTAELMEKGIVAKLSIHAILLQYSEETRKIINHSKVDEAGRPVVGIDYDTEMNFIISHKRRNAFITNLTLSLEGNTLLLFQYVEKHGKGLYDMIRKGTNRPVYYIDGQVDDDVREEIRHIIETETDAILIASFGTLSTGTNIRNLHNLIFASPSKSKIRNLQSIGRGLRLSDTKSECTLYDIGDDLHWHSKENHTLKHFVSRIELYASEQFEYVIHKVGVEK